MRKIVLLLTMGIIASYAYSQNRTITGIVTSPNKDPLPGVSVTIPGTNLGTVTNSNGIFSISIPPSAKSLEFSYLGFRGKTVAIGTGSSMSIALEQGVASQMDEIVVGAGGISSRKKDLGYSTTKVEGEKLTAGKATNIAAGLTGKVAGLKINAVNGGVNPSFRVVLRGQRSITGNNQALIVLDNVIVPNELLGISILKMFRM